MSITDIVEHINIGTSLFSNALLIYLSLRFGKQNLGTYKYLIMIFASYDLFLTIIHILVNPKIYSFGTVFTIYSVTFPDLTWPGPVYCACFTVPFALMNINFLHRYWAVSKPLLLDLFSNPRFAFLLALYPITQCVGWSFLANSPVHDDSHFIEEHFRNETNKTVTGWIVMHHWLCRRTVNVRATVILVIAVIIMSGSFSVAFILANKTLKQIRKAKTFSFNYRALHRSILRALFAQTAVPVLFVYIPFGCAITFPFLKIEDVLHIEICMTLTSFFPAWDAIIVILLIKDFREGLIWMFCRPKNKTSMETTAWKTNTTSVQPTIIS